ncbi:MAG: acetoacetate--CoA ligase, partial [Bradyrhizobium sp.]|nr:acetoacetate--CoA ligase [Bradyrhizobium sp.]
LVLREDATLDEALRGRIAASIRSSLSPRFVPDEIAVSPGIPRTLSGKKQELPIKKLLLGHPVEEVINKEAMANPACLDWYLAFARDHLARSAV